MRVLTGKILSFGANELKAAERRYSFIEIEDQETKSITRIEKAHIGEDLSPYIKVGATVTFHLKTYKCLGFKQNNIVRLDDDSGRSHISTPMGVAMALATAYMLIFVGFISICIVSFVHPLMLLVLPTLLIWFGISYTAYQFSLSGYASKARRGRGGATTRIANTI